MTPESKRRGFEDASQEKFADASTVEFLNAKEFKQSVKQDDNEVYMVMFAAVTDESSTDDHREIGIFLNSDDSINQIFSEYSDFQDVFSEAKANILPKHGPDDLAIDTQNKEPPFGKIYNLSQSELKVLKKYIIEQLNKEFIVPFKSPAGAPVLFAPKKDGGLRLCVDYRGLNVIIIKNRHPLPLIQEAMDRLVGAKRFIKLDIQHAYNMIRIKKDDEWKTAFRTRYGHFEYRVVPFGLINASATFQHYINRILADYLDIFVLAYLDDIFIYSVNDEEHTEHVRMVLLRLRQYNLYCKISKCRFRIT